MNVEMIRKDFPFLDCGNPSLVYFDNGATTQKPVSVINRISRFYENENSNIHRGNYALSSQASQLYEAARETVREWLDAEYADEIVFTKGCTESINLVASSVFETWMKPGDNVIVTELEHSSNYFPWKHYCERAGVEFRTAAAQMDGCLETENVLSLIDKGTKLIAITAMSNVTGFQPDLEKIISEAHKNNILVLVDAAQAIAHQVISVQQLKCDFLCFSSHKIYGPMGIGVLYGKRRLLEKMTPFLYGGDMVIMGDGGGFIYKATSGKYEAGTQNIVGALGLESAILYLKKYGFQELINYEVTLASAFRKRIKAISGIHVIGSVVESPVLAFEAEHIGAYDMGVLLASKGIAVRCGSHCAYPLMKRLGKESLCRISLAFYNTMQEIDYAADLLADVCERWR